MQPNLSSLASLLTRFRVSYPTGSLVSEFLTVHEGNYAVRALVQVGGTTLASGMAANSNIEVAEDQAKTRALEALGMTAAFPTAAFAPVSTRSPEPPPIIAAPEPLALKVPEKIEKVEKPPAEILPEATPPETPEASELPDKTAKPKKPKEEAPPPEEPQDRSDEIARIGVEMKRLGWTTIQGRDYLKQRYGKRSRQELNDPELLDFLAYLESQPAPASS